MDDRLRNFITFSLIVIFIATIAILIIIIYPEEEGKKPIQIEFKEPPKAGWDNLPGDKNIGTEVGQTAPNFVLDDVMNVTLNLTSRRGGVVIIEFITTWCGYCKNQTQELKKVYEKYKDKWLAIFTIDLEKSDTIIELIDFKDKYGAQWYFGIDTTGEIAKRYKVGDKIPVTYILDINGKIGYKKIGLASSDELSNEVSRIGGY
ncbi:MAG: TlpA disulfide reductase family protein [Candidatus Thermoplasmatota archaeon]